MMHGRNNGKKLMAVRRRAAERLGARTAGAIQPS
jgi:hypothetical protein